MFHLFVVANATYAADTSGTPITTFAQINTLGKGSIAFFDMNETLITTSTTLAGQTQFYAALGSGDATIGARVSIILPRNVQTLTKQVAIAGTLQVDTIGNDGTAGAANLPASPIAGTIAGLLIVNTTVPVNNIVLPKFRYEYIVKSGDTAASILNGIITLVNNDPNAIVVATAHQTSSVTDGIILTAKTLNTSFSTTVGSTGMNSGFGSGTNDILANCTVQTAGSGASVTIVYTSGDYNSMVVMESIYSQTEGNTNQLWASQLYWSRPSYLDSTKTYKLDTLVFDTRHVTSTVNVSSTKETVVLALVTGSASLTSVETILGILFNVVGN